MRLHIFGQLRISFSLFSLRLNVKPPCRHAGADVTHPTTFSETEPSIASVVGSLDPAVAHYAARIMIQGHRVEIISVRLLRCFGVASVI